MAVVIDLSQQPVADVGDVAATLTQRRQGDREDGDRSSRRLQFIGVDQHSAMSVLFQPPVGEVL